MLIIILKIIIFVHLFHHCFSLVYYNSTDGLSLLTMAYLPFESFQVTFLSDINGQHRLKL